MSDGHISNADDDEMGLDMILNARPKSEASLSSESVTTESVAADDEQEEDEASVEERQERFNKFRDTSKVNSMTSEEIARMKADLLYQLDRLEKKGIRLTRRFTMSTPFEDIKAELDRIKRDRELDSSVKFQRMMFSTCVTGIEFLNKKYDPFDVKLEGWSESVHDDMDSYDDVFEELHEKYKGKANMAPEIKLIFMLGGSAVKFHLMNTLFKSSIPGFDQVMKNRPDLMRQFTQAAMETQQQQQPAAAGRGGGGIGGLVSGLFGGGVQTPSTPPPGKNRMRGPSKDILTDLENPAALEINSDDGASNSGKKTRQPRRRTLKI